MRERRRVARTVLIVTENPGLVDRVGTLLDGDEECDVSFAATGDEALARIGEGGVHLVLYDAAVTLSDGIGGILRIKERFPMLPVIPVTDARRA